MKFNRTEEYGSEVIMRDIFLNDRSFEVKSMEGHSFFETNAI